MPRSNKPWFRKSHNAWYVEYEGIQHNLCPGPKNQDTKKQADVAFARLIVSLLAADCTDDALSVSDLFDKYRTSASKHLAERTYYELNRHLLLFENKYGTKEVEKLIVYDLSSWVEAHSQWKSNDTQANVIKHVKTPFGWGKKEGLLKTNPFEDYSRSFKNRKRPMTEAEYQQIVQTIPTTQLHFSQAVRFIYLTGARPSEVRKLQWIHLDLERGVILLPDHKARKLQKEPLDRLFIVTKEIADILTCIREQGGSKDFIFVSSTGRPWHRNSLGQALRRIRDKVNLPKEATLYGLRHRFGTQAILKGVDLKTLAGLMGHSRTTTTEHYVHLAGNVDHLKKAVQKINSTSSAAQEPLHSQCKSEDQTP